MTEQTYMEKFNKYNEAKTPVMVKLNRTPLTPFSLRPVMNTKGQILEYQMIFKDSLDYIALSSETNRSRKPTEIWFE